MSREQEFHPDRFTQLHNSIRECFADLFGHHRTGLEIILNRMERQLSTQSDALAAIAASLATNFATLDTEITALVAAQGSGDTAAIQASIDALSTLNTAIQADAAKLAPPAPPAEAPPAA